MGCCFSGPEAGGIQDQKDAVSTPTGNADEAAFLSAKASAAVNHAMSGALNLEEIALAGEEVTPYFETTDALPNMDVVLSVCTVFTLLLFITRNSMGG